MSNFKDNFNKLSQNVGLTIAIVTLEGTLPKDFWELLTFKQLVTICKEAYSYPSIQTQAITQLEKIPGTFEEWYKVSPSISINQDLNALVYKKLIFLATTFNQMSDSILKYGSYNKDSHIDQTAKEKLLYLAKDFNDWSMLCNYPEYKTIALEKITLLGKTSDELIKINYFNPNQETLTKAVAAIDSDPGSPLKKWGKVHQKIQLSPDLEKTALQKISESIQ